MLSIQSVKSNRPFQTLLLLALTILSLLTVALFAEVQGRNADARLKNHSQLQMQLDRLLADGWQLECTLIPLPGRSDSPELSHYQPALSRLNRDASIFGSMMRQLGDESRAAAFENLFLDLGVDPVPPNVAATRARLAHLRAGLSRFSNSLKEAYGHGQQVAADAHRRMQWGTGTALIVTLASLIGSAVWYIRRDREKEDASTTPSQVDWYQQYSVQKLLHQEALKRANIITWRSSGHAGFAEFEFASEDQQRFYGLKARMTFEEFRALIHPDDAAPAIAAAEDMISNENPYYDACYRFRAANGEWRMMHSVGSPVARASDGSPMVASGLLQDVTDLQKLSASVAYLQPAYAKRVISESATS